MTRGRRRNRVTLSGPATEKSTDEVEVHGGDTTMVDALAVRGLLSADQHRTARKLIADREKGRDTFEAMLALIPDSKSSHLMALIIRETPLAVYGRKVMGYRVQREAENWAIGALRSSLTALAPFYRGKRGASALLDGEEGEE